MSLSFDDRLDDAADGVLRLVPEALVLLLQGLDLVVDAVARLDVLRGEILDDAVLLRVDVVLELVELVGDALLLLERVLAELSGCAATSASISLRPCAIRSRAFVSSVPTRSATLPMTTSISLR